MTKAFQIKQDDKTFDYRSPGRLDIEAITSLLIKKKYQIIRFLDPGRHLCAIIEDSNNRKFFFKIATSKGISIVTENEAAWSDAVANYLPVPKIYNRGYFKKDSFYLIMEYLDGPLVTLEVVEAKVEEIISLSEKIANLKIDKLPADFYNPGKNCQEIFLNKTISHYDAIPGEIRIKYELNTLRNFVKDNYSLLSCCTRHGDFAPWHLLVSKKHNTLFLIDGEHAMSQGVEYYDIGYFIQRTYSVWKEKELAIEIYRKLLERGYIKNKLKIILSARAIGGFLDESLAPKPNYKIHEEFSKWVLDI